MCDYKLELSLDLKQIHTAAATKTMHVNMHLATSQNLFYLPQVLFFLFLINYLENVNQRYIVS